LHRSQHVTAMLNGVPVIAGQLDQNKIQKTEFRIEKVTLSVGDRLRIRQLYQVLELNCKAGEELAKASEFLRALRDLALEAGGDAPLPMRPTTAEIEDIQHLPATNDQLVAIRNKADEFTPNIEAWRKVRQLIKQRIAVWATVERLARHAQGLPGATDPLTQIEAIRTGRLLLDSADPVTPLRRRLVDLLREALNVAQQDHEVAHQAGVATLAASDVWNRLSQTQQGSLLSQVGFAPPLKPDLSSDSSLLSALDVRDLGGRRAEKDAVAGRVAEALKLAAQLLEPKVQFISVEKTTLRTAEEVGQWAERQQTKLLAALADGPVQVA
jgi:hypothetical protein